MNFSLVECLLPLIQYNSIVMSLQMEKEGFQLNPLKDNKTVTF